MDVDEQLSMNFCLPGFEDQDADWPQADAGENVQEQDIQSSQPDLNLVSSGLNPDSGISYLSLDQQTQSDTINHAPSPDHSETPVYVPDAGCQDLDDHNEPESSAEGEQLGGRNSNEQINRGDMLNLDEFSEFIQIQDVKIGMEFVCAL